MATRRTSFIPGLLLAIWNGWGLPAADRTKHTEPIICVRLSDSGIVPGSVLGKAEGVAARILSSAGVRVRWDDARAASSAIQTIDIRIAGSTPDDTNRFATSLPFARDGERIVVFFNRVEIAGKHDPIFTTRLLGHVLAHEIGHVLMRTDQHAREGIMKARWTEDDFAKMRSSNLTFDPDNVVAIRLGLALAVTP